MPVRWRVYLNQLVCSSTEAASATNTPPAITSTSGWWINTAMMPSTPPNASDPVSPMNICAGWQLNQRNPRPAPIIAAQKTVNSPAPLTNGTCRYSANLKLPAIYVNTRNTAATINVQPIARPSRPSVKFTAFELPMMVSTVSARPTGPALGKTGCLMNGTITSVMSFCVSGRIQRYVPINSASANWTQSFTSDF